MRFDIVTIFPEFFAGPLDYGIVRRAREAGLIEVAVRDLREFTHDKHRTVDDRPFGGGEGMVLKPEPLFEAVESLLGIRDVADVSAVPAVPANSAVVLLSAAGKPFRQETARRFAKLERIIFICGRYEGVDERVAEHLATDEISVGDFVLSGGELPAAMILDAVTRLLPGALGNEDSTVNESFSSPANLEELRRVAASLAGSETLTRGAAAAPSLADRSLADEASAASGILDYPHYTRPPSFRGWNVPEILMGGNHEEIRRWRLREAIAKTGRNRPELLDALVRHSAE